MHVCTSMLDQLRSESTPLREAALFQHSTYCVVSAQHVCRDDKVLEAACRPRVINSNASNNGDNGKIMLGT